MSSAQTLQKLREQLTGVALQAREDGIDKKATAFSKGKAQVVELLEKLEEIYRKDPELFDNSVLAEIRTAKVCVGMITRADLEKLESDQAKKAVVAAHKLFLKKFRIGHKGTRIGFMTRSAPECYVCKLTNNGAIDLECNICGWTICSCGACGCGVAKEKEKEKEK